MPLLFPFRFFMIKLRMKNVNTFLDTFKNSLIPHHPFYHRLVRSSIFSSIFYFISLILILNLFLLIYIASMISPFRLRENIHRLSQSLASYPKNLTITLSGGGLVTNYDRPYFMWLNKDNEHTLIAVVDETADPQKIYEYNSLLLAGARSVSFWPVKSTQKIYTVPLSWIGSQTITKNTLLTWAENATFLGNILPFLYPLALLMLFIALMLGSLIANLFYLLVASLLGLVLIRFLPTHKKINFMTVFKISLHAVTLPLLIDYALSIFKLRPSFMGFMYFVLLTLFVCGGVYEAFWVKRSN